MLLDITNHVIGTRPVPSLRLQHLQNLFRTPSAQDIGIGTEMHVAIRHRLSKELVLLNLRHILVDGFNDVLKSLLVRWQNTSQIHDIPVLWHTIVFLNLLPTIPPPRLKSRIILQNQVTVNTWILICELHPQGQVR